MVKEYNDFNEYEKKEKSLDLKLSFIEFCYKLLNNYKKYGSAIKECEEENIKKKIDLSKLEKEVEFLVNLFMNYSEDNWDEEDDDSIKELKKFRKFPIQTQIEYVAEQENEYYKIRPKKNIKRSLSEKYELEINYC